MRAGPATCEMQNVNKQSLANHTGRNFHDFHENGAKENSKFEYFGVIKRGEESG